MCISVIIYGWWVETLMFIILSVYIPSYNQFLKSGKFVKTIHEKFKYFLNFICTVRFLSFYIILKYKLRQNTERYLFYAFVSSSEISRLDCTNLCLKFAVFAIFL